MLLFFQNFVEIWYFFGLFNLYLSLHLPYEFLRSTLKVLPMTQARVAQLNRCRLQFVSVEMEGKGESDELYAVTLPRFPFPIYGFHVSAGLVCLSSDDCIYLCNPVMQQFCKLRKCSPTVLNVHTNVGFGFLNSTKEFPSSFKDLSNLWWIWKECFACQTWLTTAGV